jgi:hypothetical protein
MKRNEIKDLIIRSLDPATSSEDVPAQLEMGGFNIDFRPGFNEKVSERIFGSDAKEHREVEFVRTLYYVFNRIAITGIAAIILLLISIFITEGSISFDSFLGMSGGSEESIVLLLTGI